MTENFQILLPKNVSIIIAKLNQSGFEAYAVGGCIRDSLLGLTPHDWDICTSAKPEDMLSVFGDSRIIETGIKHGTLTVVLDNTGYEITTYRIDGQYSDNRHPDSVSFTGNLVDDLGRRDFTINAMAYNDESGLVDPYNGRDDLKKHLVRCVGDADSRLKEDALRIMRSLRFASTYGFDIEGRTSESLIENKKLLQNIAIERINTELCKLIKGKNAEHILLRYKEIIGEIIPELKPCFDFDQHNRYHEYDVYTHMIKALSNYDGTDFYVKLALFLHDIGKPTCYTTNENGGHFYGHGPVSGEIAEKVMTQMRFDNATIKHVSELISCHNDEIFPSERSVKRWLNNLGEEQFRRLVDVRRADILAHSDIGKENSIKRNDEVSLILSKIIAQQKCFSIKDLAINGLDLIEAGIPEGPEIGKTLRFALDAVIEGNLENDKGKIMEKIQEIMDPFTAIINEKSFCCFDNAVFDNEDVVR